MKKVGHPKSPSRKRIRYSAVRMSAISGSAGLWQGGIHCLENPEIYRARSVLAHLDRLTMPVVLTMGEKDPLIPVEETRKIVSAMRDRANFTYYEVPGGDHDSALWVDVDLENLRIRSSSSG